MTYGTTAPVGFAPRVANTSASLFGYSFVTRTRADVADAIVLKAMLGQRTIANFINAHCINVASHDQSYRHALRRSDMLLPDGIGMRIAARLAGRSMTETSTGQTFFRSCARALRSAVCRSFCSADSPESPKRPPPRCACAIPA